MRRLAVGLAILAVAFIAPNLARADDQQIAEQIVQQLDQHKQDGRLRGFGIDLQVDQGTVWLKGHVANADQQHLVVEAARHVRGVRQVVDDLQVDLANSASTTAPRPAPPQTAARKPTNLLGDLGSAVKRAFGGQASRNETAVSPAAFNSRQNSNTATSTRPISSRRTVQTVLPPRPTAPPVAHLPPARQAATSPTTTQPPNGGTHSAQTAAIILQQLQQYKANGQLKNFGIDLKVEHGVVRMSGHVATQQQQQLVLEAARHVDGVTLVVNDLQVTPPQPVAALPSPATAVAVSRQGGALGTGVATQHPAIALPQPAPQPARSTVATARPATPTPTTKPTRSLSSRVDNAVATARPATPTPTTKPTRSPISQMGSAVASTLQKVVSPTKPQLRRTPTTQPATSPPLFAAPTPAPVPAQVAPVQIAVQSAPAQLVPTQTAPAVTNVQYVPAPVAAARAAPVAAAATAAVAPATIPAQVVAVRTPVQFVPMPTQAQLMAVYQARSQMPMAFAAAHTAGRFVAQPSAMPIGQMGAPISAYAPAGNATPARYDSPQMPAYAWPSYAPHPNYGAVTYPKQYSPTAWPYIGPFYPYPQVPLGWRKVSLEWKDGWWMLDFKDRN